MIEMIFYKNLFDLVKAMTKVLKQGMQLKIRSGNQLHKYPWKWITLQLWTKLTSETLLHKDNSKPTGTLLII